MTKPATRIVSAKSGTTEYQVFLRSVTNINEPSNDVVRPGAGTICTDEKESAAGKLKIDTFQIFLELKMLFVKYS
jgi:hypothetical protein